MNTPGERRAADICAETVAMMAARPEALKILSVELRKAVLKHAGRIYMFPVMAVCIIPIVIMQELMLGLDDTVAAWRWLRLGLYALAGVAAVLAWLVEMRYMRRFRQELPARIRQAGLIERLALGPGELPDIYRYTVWPFSLLLGPPPRTYLEYARLVAANADWYLLPEPRRYYSVARLPTAFQAAVWVGVVVYIYQTFFSTAWRLPHPQHPQAGQLFPPEVMLAEFVCILAFALIATFLISHALQRLVHAADALYFEAKHRLRELEC